MKAIAQSTECTVFMAGTLAELHRRITDIAIEGDMAATKSGFKTWNPDSEVVFFCLDNVFLYV